MIFSPRNVSEILEELTYIRSKAPNRFKEGESLDEASRALNEGLGNSSAELRDETRLRKAKALSTGALLAYRRGDLKEGDRLLDEMEDVLMK